MFGGYIVVDYFLQIWFKNWDIVFFKNVDFFGIDVQIENVIIDFSQIGVIYEIDIVGIDNGDFYKCFL